MLHLLAGSTNYHAYKVTHYEYGIDEKERIKFTTKRYGKGHIMLFPFTWIGGYGITVSIVVEDEDNRTLTIKELWSKTFYDNGKFSKDIQYAIAALNSESISIDLAQDFIRIFINDIFKVKEVQKLLPVMYAHREKTKNY